MLAPRVQTEFCHIVQGDLAPVLDKSYAFINDLARFARSAPVLAHMLGDTSAVPISGTTGGGAFAFRFHKPAHPSRNEAAQRYTMDEAAR
jgi:hypothetical protein